MKKKEHYGAKIEVTKDGPYLVSGGVPLGEQWIETNATGESVDYREGKTYPTSQQYALCRCGHSGNKPFCDGTHKKVSFDGAETATRVPYIERAKTIEGPTMLLTDIENLCAFARFCDPKGPVWNLVQQADTPKLENSWSTRPGIVPPGDWSCGIGQPVKPSNRNSNPPLA